MQVRAFERYIPLKKHLFESDKFALQKKLVCHLFVNEVQGHLSPLVSYLPRRILECRIKCLLAQSCFGSFHNMFLINYLAIFFQIHIRKSNGQVKLACATSDQDANKLFIF